MIGVVLGALFHMQTRNCIRNKIYIHDVHAIARAQGQRRQSSKKNESAHHVELGRLCAAAVAENNAGSKNRLWRIGKQLANHVLAEFLSACIWIVIGTVPIDRLVFGDDLVLPLSRNRNRAYVTEAPQSVIVINLHSELDYLKCAAQVHV